MPAISRVAVALLGLSASVPAMGQEALYGAQPPPGSAFVRFANATGTTVEVRPSFLAASTLGTDTASRISAYGVVPTVAGKSLALTINAGGHSAQTTLKVAPDSFTTVLVRETSPGQFTAVAVTDGAEFNQARARLSFYNASQACPAASLALAPVGTAVFSDVAPGAVKTRSVNPVKAMVRASCTGQTAEDVMLDHMEIGGSYSVWLMLPGGKPATFITRDKTLPFKK
jgi:hypothetical protein